MTPHLLAAALLLAPGAHAVPRRAWTAPAPATPADLAPQTAPVALPPPAAPPVTTAHQLPGSAFVETQPYPHDRSDEAARGAGPTPAPTVARTGGLYLHIDPDAEVRWRGHAGVRVRVINGGDDTTTLRAQDSRIDLIQQVQRDDAWRDLEHLPKSWCGNSFHAVSLHAGGAWVLDLPRYAGPIDADLRFVLRLDGREVASAPFRGGVTEGQLAGERGTHTASDVMDPTVGW